MKLEDAIMLNQVDAALRTANANLARKCDRLAAANAELVAALTEIDTCTPPFGCESVYEWMAVRCKRVARAALVAHPASSAGNDGGADYEAKARKAIRHKFLEATPVPLTGTVSIAYGPPMVIDEEATVAAFAAALTQSAADKRERCEAIARGYRITRGVDFVRGEVEDMITEIADAIAALGSPSPPDRV